MISLAPNTNTNMQSSRRSERNGSNGRRKRKLNARARMNGSEVAREGSRSTASPTTRRRHRPVRTMLLGLDLIYRLLDMLLLAERCRHNTLVASNRCTKPRAMAKSTPDIHHIHPTGRVSKCRAIFRCPTLPRSLELTCWQLIIAPRFRSHRPGLLVPLALSL